MTSDTDAGQDVLVCPRCKREVHPWPIPRGGRCSEKRAVYCIRDDDPATWKS